MSGKITIHIRAGTEGGSTTVDDLLDQVRDYFEILGGVEETVAEDGARALEWRIVHAQTNSPIALEAVAFARD